ncbi:MAG TPA: universal stress protein, partial [Chthoniobacterales bacterium]|nr:universal stress protein [Chthoniobacterales bacterium]
MTEAPYRTIAVAATFSPRFHQVLAEANRIRERFGATLSIIYVGKKDATSAAKFSEAITKLKLPADSAVHYYEQGDPATAILGAADKLKADLL